MSRDSWHSREENILMTKNKRQLTFENSYNSAEFRRGETHVNYKKKKILQIFFLTWKKKEGLHKLSSELTSENFVLTSTMNLFYLINFFLGSLEGQLAIQSTTQHTATRGNTLQHTATRGNTLQHTATRGNTLQHTVPAVCCSVLLFNLPWKMTIELTWLQSALCSMLQCVAVCCSVLQCAAVCCSVLQCAAAL